MAQPSTRLQLLSARSSGGQLLCAPVRDAVTDMICAGIGDDEAAGIATGIAGSQTLTELGLAHNKIGDKGIAAIGVALADNANLKLTVLRVNENHFTRHGAKDLVRGKPPGLHLYF